MSASSDGEAQLLAYAAALGLSEEERWLAAEALSAPLPVGWSEHEDAGRVYFVGPTGQSQWFPPADEVVREVVACVRGLPAERAEAERGAQQHLDAARDRAQESCAEWQGPFQAEAGSYYYHAESDTSSWTDPVEYWQELLDLRRRTLERCLSMWDRPRPARLDAEALELPSCDATAPRTPSLPSSVRSFYSVASNVSPGQGRRPAAPEASAASHSAHRSEVGFAHAQRFHPSPQACPQLAEPASSDPTLDSAADPEVTGPWRGPEARRQTPELRENSPSSTSRSERPSHTSLEAIVEIFARAEMPWPSLQLPGLGAEERRAIKLFAQSLGLRCESFGMGADRTLHIFRQAPPTGQAPPTDSSGAGPVQEFTFGADNFQQALAHQRSFTPPITPRHAALEAPMSSPGPSAR